MTAELTPPCEGLGLDSACSPRVWKEKKKQIGHHARPRRAAATQLHMTTALSSGTSLWVLCTFRRWSFRWSIATPTAYDPTGPELCPGLSIYICKARLFHGIAATTVTGRRSPLYAPDSSFLQHTSVSLVYSRIASVHQLPGGCRCRVVPQVLKWHTGIPSHDRAMHVHMK